MGTSSAGAMGAEFAVMNSLVVKAILNRRLFF